MTGKISKVEFAKDSKWVAKYGREGEIFISRELAGDPDFSWSQIFQDTWNTTISPRREFEISARSLIIYPTVPDDAASAKIAADEALRHTNEKVEQHNAKWEEELERHMKSREESEERKRKALEEVQKKLDAT